MGKPTGERIVGPLLPMARGFLLELIEMGYSTTAQSKRLRLMGALSSWLAANGIDPSELTAEVISGFLAPIRVRGPEEEWFSRVGERQLVDYLRRVGLVPAPEPAVVTDPMERLVGSLVEYLVRERGLKDGSSRVQEYRQTTRLFLAGRLDGYGGGFDRLTASDVTTFVVTECRHRSPRMSVGLASSLRGLLRFLFIEGLTPIDLTGAVPKVPDRRRRRARRLPTSWPPGLGGPARVRQGARPVQAADRWCRRPWRRPIRLSTSRARAGRGALAASHGRNRGAPGRRSA